MSSGLPVTEPQPLGPLFLVTVGIFFPASGSKHLKNLYFCWTSYLEQIQPVPEDPWTQVTRSLSSLHSQVAQTSLGSAGLGGSSH